MVQHPFVSPILAPTPSAVASCAHPSPLSFFPLIILAQQCEEEAKPPLQVNPCVTSFTFAFWF
jgi:hypothetical protein